MTAAPFRNHNDQIAAIERDMPDDYRQHKRAMHKAGVRASSSDNPGAVRHLRKQSLADVVENRAKGEESARPKPPCIGLADVLLVLVYEAVAGECPRAAHPLDEPGGGPTSSRLVRSPMHLAALPSVYGDLGDLDALGVGRCLRRVVIGNGRGHVGHECAECHGHGTAFG